MTGQVGVAGLPGRERRLALLVVLAGLHLFGRNLTLTGGPAPVRNYIEELMRDILDGKVEPGMVFDRTVGLEETPDAYRAMDQREALKVLVRP